MNCSLFGILSYKLVIIYGEKISNWPINRSSSMSIDGKVGINLIKITSFLVLNLKIQYNFCFEP